jgi:uncharacterized protein YjbI with pentapeptide repeats
MSKFNPNLSPSKPKNVFTKSLEADFKELFKALSKGISHTLTGNMEELTNDTLDALSAIGLTTEPEELAFLLLRRALTKALFDLVGEIASQQLPATTQDIDLLIDQLDFANSIQEVHIDQKFFDRPANLTLIKEIQSLLCNWFEGFGVQKSTAVAIADRLPSYFVYALNQEWRKNAKSYRPLIENLNTPFMKAGEREWAWKEYSSSLQRRIQEGIFDEPFSLSQIYVPLNAFYLEETARKDTSEGLMRTGRQHRRVVVSLQSELEQWLLKPTAQDAIRVISGGPGSGKSSFSRIFAAQVSQQEKLKVLFIPLHLIDPTKDLVEEVGRFVRDEGILPQNPLDSDSPEPNLLIIFDGLDELASQGKASAETARAFVREVERTVERRNQQTVKLRVLISGRELIVQENESEFRRPRQILTLLPYFMPATQKHNRRIMSDGEEYHDPLKILETDLRQQWWKNYGTLSGKSYVGLPKGLSRTDLSEVTSQPLLNYLVALSFTRGTLDFTKDINLNSIYADLMTAVHERGYEKHRPYGPIRHMGADDFSRVLEEIGLAAWHGDGRTTTVSEIEHHCRASGLGKLLDVFQEGAKAGVTRLLAAFFFRQYGQRTNGDPTFVFTHKSFGEYLTARRIVRAIERLARESERRAASPDEGWSEREALKHWTQICGPSAMTQYLHVFLLNEVKLNSIEKVAKWQENLVNLFNYALRYGLPMEELQITPFKEALFQSRNAEEALLISLNACSRVTEQICKIEQPDLTTFSSWFKRIQGQRTGADSVLASDCLSFLDLTGAFFDIGDFYGANFSSSCLKEIKATFTCFINANFENADLQRARLHHTLIRGAIFKGANFHEANIFGTSLEGANLEGANLERANINGSLKSKMSRRSQSQKSRKSAG